jgi:hypothetical protein
MCKSCVKSFVQVPFIFIHHFHSETCDENVINTNKIQIQMNIDSFTVSFRTSTTHYKEQVVSVRKPQVNVETYRNQHAPKFSKGKME